MAWWLGALDLRLRFMMCNSLPMTIALDSTALAGEGIKHVLIKLRGPIRSLANLMGALLQVACA